MPEELFFSVLLGSFAWLVGKRWEITERRRLRYIEIASRLSALFETGTPESRRELLNEISKLWIDADRKVVLAAEKALDAIQSKSDCADLELRNLIIAMRKDANFLWNSSDLKPNEIKFRAAG